MTPQPQESPWEVVRPAFTFIRRRKPDDERMQELMERLKRKIEARAGSELKRRNT